MAGVSEKIDLCSGSGFGHAVLVRHDAVYGFSLQILIALTMWNCDNGALFVGSQWGRHPFLAAISPNKTLEGVCGGVGFCVLTTWILFEQNWMPLPQLSVLPTIVFGILIALLGILGDLTESYFKRLAKVKDSGHFFPGHGGCLDRMDSMLFIAPFVYYANEMHKLYVNP